MSARQRRVVEEAARACSDILIDGWQETVADRATTYVSESTWSRLLRGSRRTDCRVLADIARAILAGKTKLHDLGGTLASRLMSLMGRHAIEQRFARELGSRVPLPTDAQMVATARGAQITGIVICLVNGDDLNRCQCFIDLALSESKTRLKSVLVAAMDDWAGLGQFRPKITPAS